MGQAKADMAGDLQEMGVSGSDTHEARSIASDRAHGDNSSPSVPAETAGPKSNYIQCTADRLLLY